MIEYEPFFLVSWTILDVHAEGAKTRKQLLAVAGARIDPAAPLAGFLDTLYVGSLDPPAWLVLGAHLVAGMIQQQRQRVLSPLVSGKRVLQHSFCCTSAVWFSARIRNSRAGLC